MLTLEEFKRRVTEILIQETGINDPQELEEYKKDRGYEDYIINGYFAISHPEFYGGSVNEGTRVEVTASNIIND